MSIPKELIREIENGDKMGVKLFIKNSLVLDPTGEQFAEMLKYAQDNIPDLMDEHDGEVFKPQEEWNIDYYNEQTVKIVSNFSHERGELLKKMAKQLFYLQAKQPISATEDAKQNDASTRNEKVKNEKTNNSKAVGCGVTIAGTGLVIGGIIIADAPVIVPVIGGVAIGVGVYLLAKK